MSVTPVTVIIVEDNPHIRKNLVSILGQQEMFRISGDYGDAESAADVIVAMEPTLVVMDIELPGMSGIECLKKIKSRCPKTQFMMFTVFEESDHVFNALRAGASGYLLKTSTADEITQALKELLDGGSPMSPLIARKVVASFQGKATEQDIREQLSDREMEILELLSEGLLYKEISDKLQITLGTVKQHLHRVYEKLHVNNKTEAINKVFKG